MKIKMLFRILQRRQNKLTWAERLTAIVVGFKQIFYAPISSFFLILIAAFALFLATTCYVFWENRSVLHDKWGVSAEISLYLKKNVKAQEATALLAKLQPNPAISRAILVQSDDGMKSLIVATELNQLLASFRVNPLPHVIIIYPKIKLLSPAIRSNFIDELQKYPEVEMVQADVDWLQQGYNFIKFSDHLFVIFVVALIINWLLVLGGMNYFMAKFFIAKSNRQQIIAPYQCAWCGLFSGLLAMLAVRLFFNLMVNQGQNILLFGPKVGCEIVVILLSVFLSFFIAKVAAKDFI